MKSAAPRVGIVVQRCHSSITGGSEVEALHYARLLSAQCQVEILTTTALDYVTWKNELRAGPDLVEGIPVRRFAVTIGRTPYWHQLHERLIADHEPRKHNPAAPLARPWSIALQEEFIRQQGPYCEGLLAYLEQRHGDYDAIIFVSFLYPTTYFGIQRVPSAKALLVPTLHDEPTAHLSAFRDMAHRVHEILWNAESERALGERLWGALPGRITSMAVGVEPAAPLDLGYPYVLYCGRIDAGKRCDQLIEYFLSFKRAHPGPLKLVLTGHDHLGIPQHAEIVHRGFVPEGEKRALMAGAQAFLMPSPFESLSIVTLEAMGQRTLVLANGACAVLADHVERSQSGRIYTDFPSFESGLSALLDEAPRDAAQRDRARAYVLSRFSGDHIRSLLLEAVGSCAPSNRPLALTSSPPV
ncbi:MAG: glycosyltransferase family 4 protein [Archangium sp.]|nr:glycosyltransferase family 4 protein [Archangium sp.]